MSRSRYMFIALAEPAASVPPSRVASDQPERRHRAGGEEHRRHGDDQQQHDDPGLREGDVGAHRVARAWRAPRPAATVGSSAARRRASPAGSTRAATASATTAVQISADIPTCAARAQVASSVRTFAPPTSIWSHEQHQRGRGQPDQQRGAGPHRARPHHAPDEQGHDHDREQPVGEHGDRAGHGRDRARCCRPSAASPGRRARRLRPGRRCRPAAARRSPRPWPRSAARSSRGPRRAGGRVRRGDRHGQPEHQERDGEVDRHDPRVLVRWR